MAKQFTCDKCRAVAEPSLSVVGYASPEKWENVLGYDLCLDCVHKLLAWLTTEPHSLGGP